MQLYLIIAEGKVPVTLTYSASSLKSGNLGDLVSAT